MHAIAVTPKKAGSAQKVELPKPEAVRGLALMRVLEVGIDGTDTEINNGEYGEPPPGSSVLVIGHEAVRVVEQTGSGVRGVAAGDLVVSSVRRTDTYLICLGGAGELCLTGN